MELGRVNALLLAKDNYRAAVCCENVCQLFSVSILFMILKYYHWTIFYTYNINGICQKCISIKMWNNFICHYKALDIIKIQIFKLPQEPQSWVHQIAKSWKPSWRSVKSFSCPSTTRLLCSLPTSMTHRVACRRRVSLRWACLTSSCASCTRAVCVELKKARGEFAPAVWIMFGLSSLRDSSS